MGRGAAAGTVAGAVGEGHARARPITLGAGDQAGLGGPASGGKGPVDIVRATWVDVAGFSIASTVRVETLASCIRDVRRASVNTDIKVMVGGPLLQTRPNLVQELGADASAFDAAGAVREARGLVSMRTAAD